MESMNKTIRRLAEILSLKQISVKHKFVVYYSVLMIAFVTILSNFAYTNSTKILRDKSIGYTLGIIEQIRNNIDISLSQIDLTTYLVFANRDIQDILKNTQAYFTASDSFKKYTIDKLRTPAMMVVLLGLMVPIHSEIVPLYIFFAKLGLKNPQVNLIGVFVAFSIPLCVFLISGFIKALPLELEEAAVIEGSGLIRVFFSIILPLLKPVIATVIIFNFLNVWNDFFTSLIFINQDSQKTLQLGISSFTGNYATKYGELLTAVMISVIPSTIVYMIFQEKIISGLTAGAVKG